MFDRPLATAVLMQIDEALDKIQCRTADVKSADDFTNSAAGAEKLDGLCMLFLAVGEAIKNFDKITHGQLLRNYTAIDWKGVMGFRDVLAHHYFDIDAEQVFWFCSHSVAPLRQTINQIISDIQAG